MKTVNTIFAAIAIALIFSLPALAIDRAPALEKSTRRR